MNRILIIGATSAIAEAWARQRAASADHLFLVARDDARLQTIAADLRVRGASQADTACLDLDDIAAHEAMLDSAWQALKHCDQVLIAYGTLPDQSQCFASTQATLAAWHTNATSCIALMTALAQRLRAQGKGTLAVISSVAGDRGRASNAIYGTAKAAISTYASALRQSLGRNGVHVLTIKPGFVDTPMTAAFSKGPLWASAETVAKGIDRAIRRQRASAYLPSFWALIMLAIRSVPEPLFRRMKF